MGNHFQISLSRCDLPKHVGQDAAAAIVFRFLRRIHADLDSEGLGRPTGGLCGHRRFAAGGDRIGKSAHREGLETGQAKCFAIFAREELARQHAHSNEIGTVDALVALGDHCLDAE